MNIEIKLFLKFKRFLPADSENGRVIISLEENATVGDLMSFLDIPIDEPGSAVINGISIGVEKTHILKNGDVVSFFTPAAGG